ncbi:MFS transporter [Altererythrobacter sp. GH1-8]|uniref:MFS transporter n=1 Tax=Altererythrobacter sp. GH1-8 TaxID=3349333 RepID=UPI00374DD6D2
MATSAASRWALPAFADNRRLRLFLGTMLYLAQGFPQGVIFYAIPSWLAVNGQPAAAIGLVATAVTLPWSFKFLMGGVVDRYAYMAMGRRRGWLVGAQFVIVMCFVGFAVASPDPSETAVIIAFAFALSISTAVQDIALDAMVIDLTPEEELGQLNGFMFAGKLIGIAGGSAFIAYLIEYHSIETAMLGAMVLFAIPAVSALLIRERKGEKLLPWMPGEASAEAQAVKLDAWLPILKEAFKSLMRRDVLIFVALVMSYGAHQTISDNSIALFAANSLGWGETRLNTLGGILNLVGAGICLSVGGWLVDRIGPMKMALMTGLPAAALYIAFVLNDGLWQNSTVFTGWYFTSGLLITQFYLTMLVVTMRVTDEAAAATNFNLLMGAFALGGVVSGLVLGQIDDWAGFYSLFGMAGALLALSALLAFGLSARAGGRFAPEEKEPLTGVALP